MPGDNNIRAIQNILRFAMVIFVGILIIYAIYNGAVVTPYTNEYLGDADKNGVTTFITDNIPISSSGIVLRNSTGGIIPESATAPGWQLIDAQTGTIAVNYTGGT